MGYKVRRGATSNFTWLLQILVLTVFVLTLQPNPIHIANIGVTCCPLRDNPQIKARSACVRNYG